MEPFETRRLLLRPLAWSDLDDLFRLYADPDVMRYVTGRPRTLAMTRERLQKHIRDHEVYGFGLCAAVLRKTGEMIGRCGLEPIETTAGLEGEGAWMFAKDHWNQGLATEFGMNMIPRAFARKPLKRVFARADEANTGSIRMMQKIGMAYVGKVPTGGVEYEIRDP